MEKLMLGLMAFAAAHTGLPMADELPDVVQKPPERLWGIFMPDAEYDPEGRSVSGLYDHRSGTIYLPDQWAADDVRDVSILLHELVHHLQHEAGVTYQCRGAMEAPAYAAQFAFIEAAGKDPFELLEMNGLFLLMVTTCQPGDPSWPPADE